MPDLLNKIVDYLLKAIATLLVSGTGYQLFDGKWFGQTIFSSYLLQQNVTIVTTPAWDDLYSTLGSGSLTGSISNISPFWLLLSLVLVLALVAHVLFKSNLTAARAADAAGTPSPPHNRDFELRLQRLYVDEYYGVTLATFAGLVCVFVLAQFRLALVILLVVIVAPVGLYLVLYSKDAVNGTFTERFVWITLLVCLLVALTGWPYLYGRRVYDPAFAVVSIAGTIPDHCDSQQLSKGPIFVAIDKADRQLFFRLCFRPGGDKYIDFFPYGGSYTFTGKERFSYVVQTFVPPPEIAGTLEALKDQLRK